MGENEKNEPQHATFLPLPLPRQFSHEGRRGSLGKFPVICDFGCDFALVARRNKMKLKLCLSEPGTKQSLKQIIIPLLIKQNYNSAFYHLYTQLHASLTLMSDFDY